MNMSTCLYSLIRNSGHILSKKLVGTNVNTLHKIKISSSVSWYVDKFMICRSLLFSTLVIEIISCQIWPDSMYCILGLFFSDLLSPLLHLLLGRCLSRIKKSSLWELDDIQFFYISILRCSFIPYMLPFIHLLVIKILPFSRKFLFLSCHIPLFISVHSIFEFLLKHINTFHIKSRQFFTPNP